MLAAENEYILRLDLKAGKKSKSPSWGDGEFQKRGGKSNDDTRLGEVTEGGRESWRDGV